MCYKVLTSEERCRIIIDMYDELILLAHRIVSNMPDSEDVVQRATQLFLDEKKQPRSRYWLYPTTIRLAYDLLKDKRKSISVGLVPDIESKLLDPSRQLLKKDLQEMLHKAISMTRPEYRAVISLFYLEGKSLKEGAEILDITPGAFAIRLHRARRRLKAILME